jgi:SulP family sulfate permease
MIDIHILGWMQNRRLRLDAVVAVMVVVATLSYDLLVGLAVGVMGSVFLFIRGQLLLPVIHDRVTGRQRRSLKGRSEEERSLLDEHGDRIVYVELRGILFFGTADRLFTELMPDLERPVWMVINMRRVQHIDTSAMYILRQMAARLRRSGGTMVYAKVVRHISGTSNINKVFRQLGRTVDLPKVKVFKSSDVALEYVENKLLRSVGWEPSAVEQGVDLAANNLCADLSPATIEVLAEVSRPLSFDKKARVYVQGDYGDAVYLVLRGEVELRLPTGRYHYKRIAKIGPGGYFGSLAFLRPGPRSTMTVVTRKAELLLLDRVALQTLERRGEQEAVRLIMASVIATVTSQLRWTRAELARIESG